VRGRDPQLALYGLHGQVTMMLHHQPMLQEDNSECCIAWRVTRSGSGSGVPLGLGASGCHEGTRPISLIKVREWAGRLEEGGRTGWGNSKA